MSDQFLRRREVQKRTSLSNSTIWRLESRGEFPRRRKISPGAVAWLQSEIEAWIAERECAVNKPELGGCGLAT